MVYHKELLLKEIIRSLLREVSVLKREANEENLCLIQWSPFDIPNFFSVLATPLQSILKCANVA